MTQNYIFVDIDGPLLPGKSYIFENNQKFYDRFSAGENITDIESLVSFDPWCVQAHNVLAQTADAKIVIVSNWRRWASIEQIQQIFYDQGLRFNYADPVSCIQRGISSERVHDIASHMEEELPDNSQVLIIDDADLNWLNGFFTLENPSESDTVGDYGFADHNDKQIGVIREKNIRWKWLEVDYKEGLSYQQFKIGMDFLVCNDT